MTSAARFADRVVIVTGGASGIGLATAKRFASEGARLVIADLNGDKAAAAAREAEAAGAPAAWATVCDVSREEHAEATVAGALERFGRIDVIVNNAGLMVFKPLEEHTNDDWLRVLHVDLLGTFYFTKQAFLCMKPGGCVVNVSSIHAEETTPLVCSYAAAKAAVVSLTRSAALEGRVKGIRVNAILPGAVDTPMLWENPNIKSGLEQISRADVGRPEDIAGAIAYLASDDASFVCG
ncbi:MAG TPA: SDR family oxidoreductase, partial [Bryobacteraceae bacterium]|nr:SDR family oxidoreductase [Bryobacteraceae bacterium]